MGQLSDDPDLITEIDVAMLMECMSSNDDLGVVLRTHLEIERAMIRVLEKKYPNYGALKHDRFTQHLKALRALGATGPIFQIADQINNTRNELAHVKKGAKMKLSEKDIVQLRSQASGAFGNCTDVLDFIVDFGKPGPLELRHHSLAQQFAVIGFMAAAAIDTIPQREPQ